jgi:hypothetical protein
MTAIVAPLSSEVAVNAWLSWVMILAGVTHLLLSRNSTRT